MSERSYPFHSNEFGGRSAWAQTAIEAYRGFIAAGAKHDRAVALAIAEADAEHGAR